jgi:glycerol-3-phosphate acyltransferase PlsY
MIALLLSIFGFFMGSLPLAVWLGRFGLRRDIRAVGDHNPGAFNVIRAGGLMWGGLAIMLEVSKAAIPVGLAAQVFRIDGLGLIVVAMSPILGHAFSPFLGFRGGKAIATTLGTWIGLTLWNVPLVGIPMLVFWSLIVTVSGWALMFTMAGIAVFLLLSGARWEHAIIVALNIALLAYKHQSDLNQPVVFRLPSFIARKRG